MNKIRGKNSMFKTWSENKRRNCLVKVEKSGVLGKHLHGKGALHENTDNIYKSN